MAENDERHATDETLKAIGVPSQLREEMLKLQEQGIPRPSSTEELVKETMKKSAETLRTMGPRSDPS